MFILICNKLKKINQPEITFEERCSKAISKENAVKFIDDVVKEQYSNF